MPIIYLSPSTQDWNPYVNGGTEEEWMNLLADKMVPMLDASGIRYARNTPDMTAASSIAASNAGNYDFHLALHSNAAAGAQAGKARGSIVDEAARVIVLALTEYFGIPFFEAENRRTGVVDVEWGNLNVRARPNTSSAILAQAPSGAPITIINSASGWYLVNYNGTIGYVSSDFVTLT